MDFFCTFHQLQGFCVRKDFRKSAIPEITTGILHKKRFEEISNSCSQKILSYTKSLQHNRFFGTVFA